ncbi:MAG: hypothetical protein WDN49_21890 [Acetobacteraceae bacterium]
MRLMDVLLVFPSLLLAIVVVAILGPGSATPCWPSPSCRCRASCGCRERPRSANWRGNTCWRRAAPGQGRCA